MTTRSVRVAIAGLGNCANSLIQGARYYAQADTDTEIPGLMHVDLGGYHVGDIEFVAAFDVDAAKVGSEIAKAMWAGRNDTIRFADVPDLGVEVLRGPTLDGLGRYYRDEVEDEIDDVMDDVERHLGAEDIRAAANALVVRRYLQRLIDEIEEQAED